MKYRYNSISSLKDVLELRAKIFNENGVLSGWIDRFRNSRLIYYALMGTVIAPDRTRNSILSTFDQKVRIFSMQNDLVQMMNRNTLELRSVGDRKSAVFLIMPDEKTTYHRLISLFVKQSYEYLIFLAQSRNGAAFSTRINYILDEFSTLPTIKDFPAMITAARSRNIRFNLVVQSQKQLQLSLIHIFSSVLAFVLITVNIVISVDDFNKCAGIVLMFAGALVVVFGVFRMLLYYSSKIKFGILKTIFSYVIGLLLLIAGFIIGNQLYVYWL